jgi:hypothetical protein
MFNLPEVDIQLLVATYNRILKVDCATQSISTFYIGDHDPNQTHSPRYYGITWEDGIIYAIASTEPAISVKSRYNRLIKLSPGGNILGEIPGPHRFYITHQIQAYDGNIWLTDTGNNLLKSVLTKFPYTTKSYRMEGTELRPDANHLNSLWFDGGYIYVMGHNRGPSTIWKYTYPEFRFVESWIQGSASHNIFRLRDDITVCNSRHATIIEGKVSRPLIRTENTWCRGICHLEDYLIVGLIGINSKQLRPKGDCQIAFYNTKTLHRAGVIFLEDVGQVLEIRCLNRPDKAHNQPPII